MAKYEKRVIGDFDHIVKKLNDDIIGSAASMNLVDESFNLMGETRTLLRVYDKYFMRNSSRASLSLAVVGNGDQIFISAIGAGGGQGLIFNFSWGAESELVDVVSESIRHMGL